MSQRKIILASTSPRRQELLRWTGLKFEVEASGYEEDINLKMPPRELARFLGLGKARVVAARHKNALVIGGDTVVACGGRVFEKPRDAGDARQMLRFLSGRRNDVFTSLVVIDSRTGRAVSRVAEANVYFRKMSEREIAAYVRTGEPFDKAAGYAMQGRSAIFIRKIEGDFWGGVGLSLYELANILKTFGIELPKGAK